MELGSRRDQEKGGGAGLSREPRRVEEKEGGGGVVLSREPSRDQEVELGPHSWRTVAFLGTVIVTLFRTAIETAISGVYPLPHTGEKLNRVKI